MGYTPEEKLRREEYARALRAMGCSESTVRSYRGSVSSKGELTIAVREAGLLSDDQESLLAVQDAAQVRSIQSWWEYEGLAKNMKLQSHMSKWLELRIKPDDQDTTRSAGQRPDEPVMEAPPNGVRLSTLLGFFWHKDDRDTDKRLNTYSTLLKGLTQDTSYVCDWNDLKEHTAGFCKLRSKLLAANGAKVRLGAFQQMQLAERCQQIVTGCMDLYGGELFADLVCREVPYEESLLFSLEQLHAADAANRPDALLSVFQQVARSCSPAERSRTQTIDYRFLSQPLMYQWLTSAQFPKPRSVRAPRADSAEGLRLLNMISDEGMLDIIRAFPSQNREKVWREAEKWLDRADKFLSGGEEKLTEDLIAPTARTVGKGPRCMPVPEQQLLGGPKNSLFRAKLQLRMVKLALENPIRVENRMWWGSRLMIAELAIYTGLRILDGGVAFYQSSLETMAGREDPLLLRVQFALLRVEYSLQQARREIEENCLGDGVQLYFRPARLDLEEAYSCIEELSSEQREPWLTRWQTLCRECGQTFFDQSPVMERMGLRSEEESPIYQMEFQSWRERLAPELLPVQAPHVVRPLDVSKLRSAEDFEAVYSGVFDSVSGKDPKHQETMELKAFQLLASAKTGLLQMNQAVDNRSVLKMMGVPGFRQACREGYITLSCYRKVNDPKTYLINCLKKRTFEFEFSSSGMYECLDGQMRQIMLNCLDPLKDTSLLEFPEEYREEAEFLLESYMLLFECFQPSDLLRYHQNGDRRYPPRRAGSWLPENKPLSAVIRERLELLIQAAENGDPGKDLTMLRALSGYAEQWQDLDDRSLYNRKIKACMREHKDPQTAAQLEKFRKLVDQCYFLANGRRSCRKVLLTETDSDLTLDEGYSILSEKQDEGLNRLFYQAVEASNKNGFGWPDTCEIALTVREASLRDRKLAAKHLARVKERYTGVGFTTVGDENIANQFISETSQGVIRSIRPAKPGEAKEILEFNRER